LTFDGDSRDSSGFANNGLAAKTPAYVTGKRGQAVRLDGADSFVQLPANIASSSAFTFASWVYWEGGAAGQRIFDFGDNLDRRAGSYRYMFLSPNAGGFLRFGIRNGTDGTQTVQTTAALPSNSWQHVAVTISGSTVTLYVNGVQQATGTVTTAALSATPSNYLGKSQWPTDPMFKGQLDDVQIFDKALTGTQVAALMTNNAPQFSTSAIDGGAAFQGQAYTGTVAGLATDADGDAITYAKNGGPAWLQVAANGTLSGTPTDLDQGVQDFTITATDPTGASGYAVISITLPIVSGNGVWTSTGGGAWSDGGKWVNSFPASGTGFTADFSALSNSTPATITLDSSRTLGKLSFENSAGGGNWTLAGTTGSTLTLSTGATTAPSISVAQNTLTISTPLAGTAGFTKYGSGRLILSGTHTITGTVSIDTGSSSDAQGAVRLAGPSGLTTATSLQILTNNGGSSTLELDGSAGSATLGTPITLSGRNNASAAIRNIAGTNNVTRGISFGSGGSYYIVQSDAGTLNLGGTIQAASTGTRNLTLQGNGNGVITGVITNGSATVGVIKNGTGKWSMPYTYPYTGPTTVTQGELMVDGYTGLGTTTVQNGGTLSGGGNIRAGLSALSGAKVRVGTQGFALVPNTAFSMIDNFESYPVGNIGTTPNAIGNLWTGVFDGTANARIVDNSGNRALAVNGTNAAADAWRGAVTTLKRPLPNGQTGTYFFRVRSSNVSTTDFIFGLSDQAATTTTAPGSDVTDPWNEYAITLSISGGNLRAFNQGVGDVNVTSVTNDTWTNVWLVVDNTAKTFRVAYSTGLNNGTLSSTTYNFGRRIGSTVGTNSLVTFGTHERVNISGQIDDLYFASGSDTTNPLNAPNLPLVAKGATMTVTGDATLAAGSTLELDVSRGTLQDKLVVGGNFTANGTLKVSLDPAQPAPALGDSFDVFDAATSSINFASLDLPALSTGLSWNTSALSSGVLSVINTPPGYTTWASSNGISGEPASGDFDKDGINNLLEYALGLNPAQPDKAPGTLDMVSQPHTITFLKGAQAVANGDITYSIESSPSLGADPYPWTAVTPTVNNGTMISYTLPEGQPKMFLRLVVTQR
jgi:autotransporter-associated beta strand protein